VSAALPLPASPVSGARGRRLIRVIATRFRDAVIVLFLVLVTIFFLGTIVGQPEEQLAPPDASEEMVQAIREDLGLDRPIVTQFGEYVTGLARGDIGESIVIARGEPAMSLVTDRLFATLKLTLAGILASAVIGIAGGVTAGIRPGSLFDRIATPMAMLFVSFPYFWFGLMFIVVFAVNLQWVPVLADDRQLASYFLPALTLGMHHGGRLFQLTRSATFDELSKSYVTVATAKGLAHRAVVVRHVMRNIGVVLATMIGWEYARMWGGTVFLAEFTFAWPGIGKLVTDAAKQHDFHVIEAGVVVAGIFVVLSNLIVDVMLGLIDKRVEVS
jgi:peptide/nickel transport system permease protein